MSDQSLNSCLCRMKFFLAAAGLTCFALTHSAGATVPKRIPDFSFISHLEDNDFECGIKMNCSLYQELSLNMHLERIREVPLRVVMKTISIREKHLASDTLELPNGTIIYLYGSGVPVLWDLRDALNLTLDLVLSEDWAEICDLVESGYVELASPLMTILITWGENRISSASPKALLPLSSLPSIVYFRKPQASSGAMRYSVFEPLENNAWKALLLCWMLCVVLCHLFHRLPLRGEGQFTSTNNEFSISEILLWIATISSGKDYPANARDPGVYQISLRIAMISAIILSVIVTAIYTAKIVVYFSKETSSVKRADDLLQLGYEIGSWSTVHIDRLFQVNESLRFNEARKAAAIKDVTSSSSEAIMKKLLGIEPKNFKYAYLSHPDGYFFHEVLNYEEELCKVSHIVSEVKSARAMYLRNNSTNREVLNWKLLQLIERGLNFRYQRNNNKLYEHTCHNKRDPVEELSLNHTFFIFFIVTVGASFAVIIAICENIREQFYS